MNLIKGLWNEGALGKLVITIAAASAAMPIVLFYIIAQSQRTIDEKYDAFKIEKKDKETHRVMSGKIFVRRTKYYITTNSGLKISVDSNQYENIGQGTIYKLDVYQDGNEEWHLRSAAKANFQEVEAFKKGEQARTFTR